MGALRPDNETIEKIINKLLRIFPIVAAAVGESAAGVIIACAGGTIDEKT